MQGRSVFAWHDGPLAMDRKSLNRYGILLLEQIFREGFWRQGTGNKGLEAEGFPVFLCREATRWDTVRFPDS